MKFVKNIKLLFGLFYVFISVYAYVFVHEEMEWTSGFLANELSYSPNILPGLILLMGAILTIATIFVAYDPTRESGKLYESFVKIGFAAMIFLMLVPLSAYFLQVWSMIIGLTVPPNIFKAVGALSLYFTFCLGAIFYLTELRMGSRTISVRES